MNDIEKHRLNLFKELESLDQKIKEAKLNRDNKAEEASKFKWTVISVFYKIKSYLRGK